MPSADTTIDYEETLSSLRTAYERMERATASKAEWIDLEVQVNQAFIDVEQAFLKTVARRAADGDSARRAQEHMNALVALRERIEGQVALETERKGSG